MDMVNERYITVEESLRESCREVNAMRRGEAPEHTCDELFALIDAMVAEEREQVAV